MGRLFWKFFCFTLLAQLLATIGIGGALWLRNHAQETNMPDIDMSPPVAFIVESAATTLQYGGPLALRDLVEHMGRRHQIYAISEDNHEFLGRAVTPQLLEDAQHLLKLETHRHVVRQVKAPDGHTYILFSPSIAQSAPEGAPEFGNAPPPPQDAADEPPGEEPDKNERRLRREHRPPPSHFGQLMPFMPLTTAVLASLIFAAMLAWYFSKPIRHLRSAFEAAAAGNLDTQLGLTMGQRHDELVDLGRDFDRMTNQLRGLMDGQRRLLHDVSHELRSPLARMQAAIGLARQKPEKMESSLERIERESVRMDKLVGELLTLSRLEAGVMNSEKEDILMGDLVAEIIDDARFEAEAKECSIVFSGDCAVLMQGRADLLHRAIENVMRNAVKHTAHGSSVTLDAQIDAKSNTLQLSILDQGPGVPDEELEAIFTPFFRGRETEQNTDGHGLGLAIAKRVIEKHDGTIRAFNRADGGMCVEMKLPFVRRA